MAVHPTMRILIPIVGTVTFTMGAVVTLVFKIMI